MYHILQERRPVHGKDSGAIEVIVESHVYVYLVSYITCINIEKWQVVYYVSSVFIIAFFS